MKKVILSILALLPACAHSSPIERLYSAIFGSQDAKEEYRAVVHRALGDQGVQNAEKVQVKQMNDRGPWIAREDLISFTAFGIWLNEQAIGELPDAERTFQFYHEAAHYAHHHHQKFLGGLTAAVGLGAVLGTSALRYLCSLDRASSCAAGFLLSLLFGYRLMPLFNRWTEKQADEAAAHALVRIGKKSIVEECIQSLVVKEDCQIKSSWWYSYREQIDYLRKVLDTCK